MIRKRVAPVEIVEHRLREFGYQKVGDGMWQCPAHPDSKPSLSVARGETRALLLHCFAGCSPSEVLEALELPEDLLRQMVGRRGPRQSRKR